MLDPGVDRAGTRWRTGTRSHLHAGPLIVPCVHLRSSHRLSQSTGDPADTASRLTWILSTDLQLLAPFGSPTVCPVVRSLVLSLSDASLARAIDAVSVNYAAHR